MIEPLIDTIDRWWAWLREDYQVLKFTIEQRLSEPSLNAYWTATASLRPDVVATFDDLNSTWLFRPTSPTLTTLQVRAAWSLFDWLGLDRVPTLYWKILRQVPNPAAALLGLAKSLDVDAHRLRHKEPAALAQFRADVRLLSQSDANPMSLSLATRMRLDALKSSGADGRARELQEIVTNLNEAIELFEFLDSSAQFSHHAEIVRNAHLLRERPARVTPEEARRLRDISMEWCDIAIGFRLAEVRQTSIAHILETVSPSNEPTPANDINDLEAKTIFEAVNALNANKLSLTKVDAIKVLDEISTLLGPLTRTLLSVQSRSMRDTLRSRFLLGATLVKDLMGLRRQNALVVLGLRPEEANSSEAIREAFRRYVLDQYPTVGGTEYHRRAHSYTMAVRYRDMLLSGL